MRICFLLGGFTANGGIGRVTSLLVNEMCEKHEIFTLSYNKKSEPNIYDLDQRVRQDYLLDHHMTMTKAILSGGPFRLRKYLKVNQIDILIACGALYFPLAILGSGLTKTKCIGWEHSNMNITSDHKFQAKARDFGIKRCDAMVVLTKSDQENLNKKYALDHLYQIYNPVDPRLIALRSPYDSHSRKIMSVGRLTYQKNYPALIEVAKKVLSDNPDWTWDIYGDGEDFESVKTQIDANKLSDRLVLKGQVSNIYELYTAYSFLVMTSRYEGFPMVLLEATSLGLPMVSFDIKTGPNEIIDHGDSGFLIEAFNVDDMSGYIQKLIDDQEIRVKMSKKCVENSEKFSQSYIVKQWEALFETFSV